MLTTTSWRVGPEALPPNIGVDLPDPRVPRPGRDAGVEDEAPGKLAERIRRTSKSAPAEPSDFDTSIETGSCRFTFDHDLRSRFVGMRLTSYPANMNLPSGGTKLNSPGRSFHLANRTQGWKTGNSMAFSMPNFPPDAERVSSRSGTPEILDVNAIEPFANAASGRPDGASVTESVSTMSTYSSLLVCRTFARRQGIAGPLVVELRLNCCFNSPCGVSAGDNLSKH